MVVEPPKNPGLRTETWGAQIAVMDSASETVLVSHLLPNLLERVF
jgi:hypothetical protein